MGDACQDFPQGAQLFALVQQLSLLRDLVLGGATFGQVVNGGNDNLFAAVLDQLRRDGRPEGLPVGMFEFDFDTVHGTPGRELLEKKVEFRP